MTQIRDEVLAANAAYASSFGAKAKLAMPPARGFAILTCMDARLDPAGFAGLAEGDAHVVRNAGGRASDDAIRSLVISYKLLGTREWFVVHHTDCGMATFTDDVMRRLLASSLKTACLRAGRLDRSGRRRLDRGGVRRLADDQKPARERRRGRAAHPVAPAGALGDPDPRLRVRRAQREARGGRHRQGSREDVRPGLLSTVGRGGPAGRPAPILGLDLAEDRSGSRRCRGCSRGPCRSRGGGGRRIPPRRRGRGSRAPSPSARSARSRRPRCRGRSASSRRAARPSRGFPPPPASFRLACDRPRRIQATASSGCAFTYSA